MSDERKPLRADIVTIIDAEEFEEAQRDPRVIKLHEDAIAYVERLRAEGRDHTC